MLRWQDLPSNKLRTRQYPRRYCYRAEPPPPLIQDFYRALCRRNSTTLILINTQSSDTFTTQLHFLSTTPSIFEQFFSFSICPFRSLFILRHSTHESKKTKGIWRLHLNFLVLKQNVKGGFFFVRNSIWNYWLRFRNGWTVSGLSTIFFWFLVCG